MHTIRLWEPSPAEGPDAWHRVTAPGGYEGWWFDAEDATAGLRIAVAIFLGDIFSPSYLSAYRRFRSRPTRFAPPRPVDHCAIYASVSERGQPTWKLVSRPGADALQVFEPEQRFELKDVASWKLEEGGTDFEIRNGNEVSIELALNVARASRPSLPGGSTGETPVPQVKGAVHRWNATTSQTTGEILRKCSGSAPRKIQFQGPSIEGHCMGTAPPTDSLGRSVIGSEAMKDHAPLFELSGAKWPPAIV